jgi:hypothetical protein
VQSVDKDAVAPQQVTPPAPPKRVALNARPVVIPVRPPAPQPDPEIERQSELQRQEFARRHIRRQHAFTLIWPLVSRRLEGRPNINASELFDELRAQYPGRFHRGQLAAFTRRVVRWREDARVRGVVIGKLNHRNTKPRGRRRPDPFQAHWAEMLQRLDADPDQTALELLIDFQARYPDRYNARHLRTLQPATQALAARRGATPDLRDARLHPGGRFYDQLNSDGDTPTSPTAPRASAAYGVRLGLPSYGS